MVRTFEGDLKQRLQDLEFAKMFGAAQAKSSFALTLAEARAKLGLTQKELAAKIGVSQAYIAKLEGGEANPTLERIGSLLAMLGLSLTTDTTTLSSYDTILSINSDILSWEADWTSHVSPISPLIKPLPMPNTTERGKVKILSYKP
ncbi:hypothetical protein ES703_99747 [subsurface metagenome]